MNQNDCFEPQIMQQGQYTQNLNHQQAHQFDGTNFDHSEFLQTITQINQYSQQASEQEQKAIIINLIDKMKCMATAINNLNQRNKLSLDYQLKMEKIFQKQEQQNTQLKRIIQQKAISQLHNNAQDTYSKKLYQQKINWLQNKVDNLMKTLKQVQQKYFEIKLRKEEDQMIIKSMEEELAIIHKFADLEDRSLPEISNKISNNSSSSFTFGPKQINELRAYAETVNQQNRILQMISEQSQQDQQECQKSHKDIFNGILSPTSPITKFSKKASSQKSIQSQDFQHQIQQLKTLLWKRSSIQENNNEDQSQLEQIKPINQNQKQIIQQIKNQSIKRRKNQSQRASNILIKLDQHRQTSSNYTKNLQQMMQQNTKKIHKLQTILKQYQQEQKMAINNQNEQIQHLMERIEEMEVTRVRNEKNLVDLQRKYENRNIQYQDLEHHFYNLQQQKKVLEQKCEQFKNQLVNANQNTLNMQYSIKQLQKTLNQLTQNKTQLQQTNQHQTLQIRSLQQKILNLQHNCVKSAKQKDTYQINNKRIEQYQQCITQLQDKLSDSVYQIKNLQQNLTKYQKNNQNLKQRVMNLQRKQQKNIQQIQNLQSDLKVLQKSHDDHKYMNQILKKDLFKVQQIEDRDWVSDYSNQSQKKYKQNIPTFKKRPSFNHSECLQKKGWQTDRIQKTNSSLLALQNRSNYPQKINKTQKSQQIKPKISTGNTLWKSVRQRNRGSLHISRISKEETKKIKQHQYQNQSQITENLKKKYHL